MLRFAKSQTYTVPVVLRTLDIVELLNRSGPPLKAKEIAAITKISHSTTYRILRTLLERGYVVQNVDGQFNIRQSAEVKIARCGGGSSLVSFLECLSVGNEPSGDQIVEALLAFLHALRRGRTSQAKTKEFEELK